MKQILTFKSFVAGYLNEKNKKFFSPILPCVCVCVCVCVRARECVCGVTESLEPLKVETNLAIGLLLRLMTKK